MLVPFSLRVLSIRKRYASGHSQTELAEEYDVHQTLIGFVVRGEMWKHVGGPITLGIKRKRA